MQKQLNRVQIHAIEKFGNFENGTITIVYSNHNIGQESQVKYTYDHLVSTLILVHRHCRYSRTKNTCYDLFNSWKETENNTCAYGMDSFEALFPMCLN